MSRQDEITMEDILEDNSPITDLDTLTEVPKPTITTKETLTGVTKYMIIPDLHIWDKNIRGRRDYVGEVKEYANQILELAKIERQSCDILICIFAGDIFHKGFSNVEEFGYWINWFLNIREVFDDVLSVLGNHEITYYKNNPFWHLVSELETNELERLSNKTYEPKGKLPLIRVVDKIQDGEWTVHLAHYTTKPLADGNKNIGIFHSSIIDNVIANVLKEKYNRDPLTNFIDHSYIKDNNPFNGIEYAFVAHMHKAFGLFTIETKSPANAKQAGAASGNNQSPTDLTSHTMKTRLRYMASLGRTNELEVNNNDLDRVIPVITIIGGKECTVNELPFKLQSREESLVLSEIEELKLLASHNKEIKTFKMLTDTVADPIADLEYRLREDETLYSIFDASINRYTPEILLTAREYINRGVDYNELEREIRELLSKKS